MKRIALIAFASLVLSTTGAAAGSPTPAPTDEPEGKITGFPIARANGGWLGLEIRDQNFVLTFYNAKKKPVAADASAAVLWWSVQYQSNPERTELTSSSNPSVLASALTVRPPYSFKLHISLLTDAGSAPPGGAAPPVPESFIIDFSG
ncbi:MAG TPA: hypothetical protein VN877_05685 [Opitutaceae bacterium]|nr:hypothetical protein [Opitutaceae bacterium]